MSVSRRLIELFEKGYKPSELVRMGYPKSTVYTVYKRWLQGRAGGGYLYIAHDIDYGFLRRFSDQLVMLGYKTVIGGNTPETLRLIRPAKAVLALVSREQGYRRRLLLEELREASSLGKPTYVLADRGAVVPSYSGMRVIELDRNRPRELVAKLAAEMKKSGLEDLIASIIIAALVAMGIVAIIQLLEDIFSKS